MLSKLSSLRERNISSWAYLFLSNIDLLRRNQVLNQFLDLQATSRHNQEGLLWVQAG